MAKLKIQLVKSLRGKSERQRRTAAALGLTKRNQTVEHEDNPVIRGMLNKVLHMVNLCEGTKA